MREQLIQYVKLLFAGTPDSEDMQQEILQNTLDRYDDLIDQGKSPEAAYRLAISGIGDVNELLGASSHAPRATPITTTTEEPTQKDKKKWMRALAIAMYICSAIPLFILGSIGDGVIGLSITCLLVAAATALIVMSSDSSSDKNDEKAEITEPLSPNQKLRKSINTICSIITLVIYIALSFATGAWYITWLVFPISGAVKGLIKAIMDYKEANKHEN